MSEIKPVSVERFDMGYSFHGQPEMQSSENGDYVEFAAYEALKAEIDSLKTERQIMQDTNLAVVRRLQSKIDSLEREAKQEARYIVEAQQEAKDDDDSWYNCGEL